MSFRDLKLAKLKCVRSPLPYHFPLSPVLLFPSFRSLISSPPLSRLEVDKLHKPPAETRSSTHFCDIVSPETRLVTESLGYFRHRRSEITCVSRLLNIGYSQKMLPCDTRTSRDCMARHHVVINNDMAQQKRKCQGTAAVGLW